MYYEMFSKAGDRACQSMVNSATKKILGKTRLTKSDIEKLYTEGINKVEAKYPEVWDTEPRGHIAHQLSNALKSAGYAYRINCWGDVVEG